MGAPSGPLGWPFLVARGRTVGYRCLLAPDFLVETHRQGIISDTVTGEGLGDGTDGVRTTTVPVADLGPITLAYKVSRVTDNDLRAPGNVPAADDLQGERGAHGPVTDEHGRPLELLYGIVCVAPGILDADELVLPAARAEALQSYRRFLADEANFAVEVSRPMPVRSTMSRSGAPTTPQPEPVPGSLAADAREPVSRPPPARPAALTVVRGLLAAAIAAAVWMAAGTMQPVRGVDLEEPGPVSADCRQPVDLVFDGTVSMRRRAEITYRWEGTHNTDRYAHRLTLEGRTTEHVSTTVVIQGSPGEEITGEQRLVVDEPNRRADSVSFVVRCDG
jgi:hypothetical protein